MISPENPSSMNVVTKEYQRRIVELAGEYADKSIHQLFSKKQNLKDFFASVEDDFITERIRPYIDKRMYAILELVIRHEVPLYRKDKNSRFIHGEERIKTVKEKAVAVFNFIKKPGELLYFLSLRSDGNELSLNKYPAEILTNYPCSLILDNTLYCVNDIDAKKLLPFFVKESISVPMTKEEEYLNSFVRSAIIHYPVRVTGFEIREVVTLRKALLSFEKNLKGEPVLSLKFAYNDRIFTPVEKQMVWPELVREETGYVFYKIIRDREWEEMMVRHLHHMGLEQEAVENWFSLAHLKGSEIHIQTYELVNWVNFNRNRLIDKGFEFEKAEEFRQYYTGPVKVEMKLKDHIDWFDLHAVVVFGDFQIPFVKLRKCLLQGIREYILPNNEIAILPEEWFVKYKEILTLGEAAENDHIILQRHHFNIVSEALENERISKNLQQLQNELLNPERRIVPLPEGLNGQLRPYQQEGFYWLYQLTRYHFGGCLADDMGLGKTVQVIALLLKIKEENSAAGKENFPAERQLKLFDLSCEVMQAPSVASLVVTPVSLVHNWENELKKFAPSLKVYKFTGTQRIRNIDEFPSADVVLSTYGIVRNEREILSKIKFKCIVLDESQVIKNPLSKTYKAITELQSEYKFVLTGTPVENSLTDLWAQLNFVNKGLLGSYHYFVNEYVNPLEKFRDEKKQAKLQLLIHPFILRRRKEEVATELPPVSEQVVYCGMTDRQRSVYEVEKSMIRNHLLASIEQVGVEKSTLQILKALNRLRLLANHPVLALPDYDGDSGKFDEIQRRIESVIEGGHKVLIFSFYVIHLTLVEQYCRQRGWKYSRLTGQMAESERKAEIQRFYSDSDNHLFLVSLKAGGVGLNLTPADYVFILDPWWNPAVENQAISRSHRIGQEKNVFVYRFISKETIEEKIQLLQEKKMALADMFINSNNPFRALDKETLNELLG